MHAKPDLRVFLKWMIARSGSVITDVITLNLISLSNPRGLKDFPGETNAQNIRGFHSVNWCGGLCFSMPEFDEFRPQPRLADMPCPRGGNNPNRSTALET